jgi:thioredoxin-dependent peroxiredoxin
MSKKTRKKSSKTSSGKAAATSSKTPAAKKRSAITKKPARTPSKRSGTATAKASRQLPSKPLKPAGKAAAARPAVAKPKTAISKPAKPKTAKPKTAKPAAAKSVPEMTDIPTGGHGGLAEGVKAPAFRLPRDGGGTVSLADFAGQKLLLFFYPRADTPGCTKEAIDFTRLAGAFAESQTVVLGVSADPPRAQESFRDKHQLAVPLVSDETHEMLQAYGVWGEKSMYGRTFLGISRTTVLIGPDGRIMRIWRNVKVDGHADEVLAAVRAA